MKISQIKTKASKTIRTVKKTVKTFISSQVYLKPRFIIAGVLAVILGTSVIIVSASKTRKSAEIPGNSASNEAENVQNADQKIEDKTVSLGNEQKQADKDNNQNNQNTNSDSNSGSNDSSNSEDNSGSNTSSDTTMTPTATPTPPAVTRPTNTPFPTAPPVVPTATPQPTATPTQAPSVTSDVYVRVYMGASPVYQAKVKTVRHDNNEQLGFGYTNSYGESPVIKVAANTQVDVYVYPPNSPNTSMCGNFWSVNTGPYGTSQINNLQIYSGGSNPCIRE